VRDAVVLLALFSFDILGAAELAHDRTVGNLEVVATFGGPMPTGVTVSKEGRIFVNFPRWGDTVELTVAEVKNGQASAYPDAAINRFDKPHQADTFVSVQSVVVDSRDRLWVLDTGSPMFQKTSYGGPKLAGIDLKQNKIFKKILFPQDVALPTTYLNDVRFDLRRGSEGTAYITDSSQTTPGLIVVDLATGKARRRLTRHYSTHADPAFVPEVEGRQVWQVDASGKRTKWALGSDGIAISPDGKTIYYSPLSSRHLFSVSTDVLAGQNRSDRDVEGVVKDLGEKGASDGLESDAEGRVYASDYEANAIHRMNANGVWDTLAHDPRMLWPDTLCVTDGYLYFTANQLHRQKQFHGGRDEREKPYVLFRLKIDGRRIAE
jgi:sugar lactone lactonase YvrE